MTSTLQQEGGRQLRWSSSQVMRVAQGALRARLHHLHAHRCRRPLRRGAAGRPGDDHQRVRRPVPRPSPRRYTSRVKNAQEAHEAIRPTTPLRSPQQVSAELNGQELALYRLIWQRTLASQMADAIGHTVTVRIGATQHGRARRRVLGVGDDDHVPRLPPGVRRGARRERRRHGGARARGAAARAAARRDRRRRLAASRVVTPPARRPATPKPRSSSASRSSASGARRRGRRSSRPIQDRGYVWKKGQALVPTWTAFAVVGTARAALRRARRLRLHRQGGDRPRRHRRRQPEEGRDGCTSSTSATIRPATTPCPASSASSRRTSTTSTPRRSTPSRSAMTPRETWWSSSPVASDPTSSAATTPPASPTTSRPTS